MLFDRREGTDELWIQRVNAASTSFRTATSAADRPPVSAGALTEARMTAFGRKQTFGSLIGVA